MKHLLTLCLCLALCFGSELQAQEGYKDAIGLRAGNLGGISYKRFLNYPSAIEGILGFNYQNGRLYTLTGLYEYHVFINYDLNLFIGAGLTLGANADEFRLLGEAIAGIEYTLPDFPLSFSLDFKPSFHVFKSTFFFNEYALTVRYVL